MDHRIRSDGARGGRPRSKQLREFDERLAAAERRIEQLENTLKGTVRELGDVSIGGPCKCGQSLLLVRRRSVYCPQCQYRRSL